MYSSFGQEEDKFSSCNHCCTTALHVQGAVVRGQVVKEKPMNGEVGLFSYHTFEEAAQKARVVVTC